MILIPALTPDAEQSTFWLDQLSRASPYVIASALVVHLIALALLWVWSRRDLRNIASALFDFTRGLGHQSMLDATAHLSDQIDAFQQLDGPSGNIAHPGHTFIVGGTKWTPFCDPGASPSNTNFACLNNDVSGSTQYAQFHPLFVTGTKARVEQVDPAAGAYCVANTIGSAQDPESTSSFCAKAPMLSCWNASSAPTASACSRS